MYRYLYIFDVSCCLCSKKCKLDEKLRTHDMGSSEWCSHLFNIKAYTKKTFKTEKSLWKSTCVMQIVMSFFDTNVKHCFTYIGFVKVDTLESFESNTNEKSFVVVICAQMNPPCLWNRNVGWDRSRGKSVTRWPRDGTACHFILWPWTQS